MIHFQDRIKNGSTGWVFTKPSPPFATSSQGDEASSLLDLCRGPLGTVLKKGYVQLIFSKTKIGTRHGEWSHTSFCIQRDICNLWGQIVRKLIDMMHLYVISKCWPSYNLSTFDGRTALTTRRSLILHRPWWSRLDHMWLGWSVCYGVLNVVSFKLLDLCVCVTCWSDFNFARGHY